MQIGRNNWSIVRAIASSTTASTEQQRSFFFRRVWGSLEIAVDEARKLFPTALMSRRKRLITSGSNSLQLKLRGPLNLSQ